MHTLVDTFLGDDEIIAGNTTIATFIKLNRNDSFGTYIFKYLDKEYYDLYFHSCIEWIYPVIDKIERMGYNTCISRLKVDSKVTYSCKISSETNPDESYEVHTDYKITAIWYAVVKFCQTKN